jgi:hypothetical protein
LGGETLKELREKSLEKRRKTLNKFSLGFFPHRGFFPPKGGENFSPPFGGRKPKGTSRKVSRKEKKNSK